jgi:alpha-1,2-mannosyltransferase
LFLALAVWSCRTPIDVRHGWRLAAEYSLVVLGMLLLSERTWKHHCVTLLLPFAVLSYYLLACQPRPAGFRVLGAVLLSSIGLMAATSTVFDKDFAKHAQVYGAYTVASLLLVGTLVVLLRTNASRASLSDLPAPPRIAHPL